jgi:hypothetical protein
MPGTDDGQGDDDAARRMIMQQDWLDLTEIVVGVRVCEATGVRLYGAEKYPGLGGR